MFQSNWRPILDSVFIIIVIISVLSDYWLFLFCY